MKEQLIWGGSILDSLTLPKIVLNQTLLPIITTHTENAIFTLLCTYLILIYPLSKHQFWGWQSISTCKKTVWQADIPISLGLDVKSLKGTGIFFTIYSQTTSMLYFSCAEMGIIGAPSATVPTIKIICQNVYLKEHWFWSPTIKSMS